MDRVSKLRKALVNDSPAVLQLHNWEHSPLPLTAFSRAALSPSRSHLLLHSRTSEIILLPLQKHANGSIASNQSTLPLKVSTPTVPVTEPIKPLRPVSDSTVPAPSDLQTPFLPPAPTPPHTFPRLKTSLPSSQAQKPNRSLPVSPRDLSPLSYSILSDVQHFEWACSADGFPTKGIGRIFKEFLFVSNAEGLFIHCLSLPPAVHSPQNASPKPNSPAEDNVFPDCKGIEGKWKRWGHRELNDEYKFGTPFSSDSERSAGNLHQGTTSDAFNIEVEPLGSEARILRQAPPPAPLQKDQASGYRGVANRLSPCTSRLVSYIVDAQLEIGSQGQQLRFNKPYSWPASAEIVTFKFAVGSPSFSVLTSLTSENDALGCRSGATANRYEMTPKHLLNQDQNPTPERISHILDIISNPSSNIIAIVAGKMCPEPKPSPGQQLLTDDYQGGIGPTNDVHQKTLRLRAVRNVLVSIILVLHWGIKWITCIDLDAKISEKAQATPWASLALASDTLFALKEDGQVFIWTLLTGNLVALVDVVTHCGLGPPRSVCGHEGVVRHGGRTSVLHDKAESPIMSSTSSERLSTPAQLAQHVSLPARATFSDSIKPGMDNPHKIIPLRQFTSLSVTANSLLIAVTDNQGIVLVVSTASYLGPQSSAFSNSSSDIQQTLVRPQHLIVRSYWDLCGTDIGIPLPATLFPNCQPLHSLPAQHSGFSPRLTNTLTNPDLNPSRSPWPAPPTQHPAFHRTTGFSAKSETAHTINMDIPFIRPKPAVRTLFLPSQRSTSPLVLALNIYGITTATYPPRDNHTCTISQNALCTLEKAIDDRDLSQHACGNTMDRVEKRLRYVGDILTFSSQGFLYIVTSTSLHVVLPSSATPWYGSSPSLLDCQARHFSPETGSYLPLGAVDPRRSLRTQAMITPRWQTEILDHALICDNLEQARLLFLQNGWSLKLLHLRSLQFALEFRTQDVKKALEGLVHVNAADSGVLLLLFTAIKLLLNQHGSDTELTQASRFLNLAAQLSTTLVRQYGSYTISVSKQSGGCTNSFVFRALVHFLEVIRVLQQNFVIKWAGPNSKVEAKASQVFAPSNNNSNEGKVVTIAEGGDPMTLNLCGEVSDSDVRVLVLDPGSSSSFGNSHFVSSSSSALVPSSPFTLNEPSRELFMRPTDGGNTWRPCQLESPTAMFTRWHKENIDAPGVVKDALKASGRLPLAVAHLHRFGIKSPLHESQTQSLQSDDVFSQVVHIGCGIVYELFSKGKTALAMAALRRLGEDIQTLLWQLAMGTVHPFLRAQAVKELQRITHFDSHDFQLLDWISLIEKSYPSTSFWRNYSTEQGSLHSSSALHQSLSLTTINLAVDTPPGLEPLTLQAGEIDGAVIGSWSRIPTHPLDEHVDQPPNYPSTGYWTAPAIWLRHWDQLTVHRILLEQSVVDDHQIPWEAKFKISVTHHNIQDVVFLLEIISSSLQSNGLVHVRLDSDVGLSKRSAHLDISGSTGIAQYDLLDARYALDLPIPRVKVLDLSLLAICTSWVSHIIEERLIKTYVFSQVNWDGTGEIMSLFARGGLLLYRSSAGKNISSKSKGGLCNPTVPGQGKAIKFHKDCARSVHRLVVEHCLTNALPHFFQLYLEFHSLALDKASSTILQAHIGSYQWALWLLYSRLQYHEYEASFTNAYTILAPMLSPNKLVETTYVNDLPPTLEDLADSGGELLAWSTLVYAADPSKESFSCHIASTHNQQPWTSWRIQHMSRTCGTLGSHVPVTCFVSNTLESPYRETHMPDMKCKNLKYFDWRESLFISIGVETCLTQMTPIWFSTLARRVVSFALGGPQLNPKILREQTIDSMFSLPGVIGCVSHEPDLQFITRDSALCEEHISKTIEDEIHAFFSQNAVFGCEYHLRCGRPITAFNIVLHSRIQVTLDQKTGMGHSYLSDPSGSLFSMTEDEQQVLGLVFPVAIINYENIVIAASCALFIELCGFSGNLLRIDIASLILIEKFMGQSEDRCSAFGRLRQTSKLRIPYGPHLSGSLHGVLADDYSNAGVKVLLSTIDGIACSASNYAISSFLKLLEEVCLGTFSLQVVGGGSPGLWLVNGQGNGSLLRNMQQSMSERWSLVTAFCRAHSIPLRASYLETLARDNDWVGFLAEAQLEGCPQEVLYQVVCKDFTNSRLRRHILIVLRGLSSTFNRGRASPMEFWETPIGLRLSSDVGGSAELFSLLADCEHVKHPGKSLLGKAKELQWPLLAVVASCYSDISPLSCLITWLEITSSKELGTMKLSELWAHSPSNVDAGREFMESQSTALYTSKAKYSRRLRKRTRVSSGDPQPFSGDVRALHGENSSKVGGGDSCKQVGSIEIPVNRDRDEESLASIVWTLCEKQKFLPLLRAFELFTPGSSFLPFLRFLQAFSQMRISEASAHLASFTVLLKEETSNVHFQDGHGGSASWISRVSIAGADAMLGACPSPYEQRCLLQLLSGSDFGDGGLAAIRFRRLYWKIQLGEPALREGSLLGDDASKLDEDALLETLEKSSQWEQARSWGRQLDQSLSGLAVHHVTETQAQLLVAEWKDLLWDVPEERVAVWDHCQALFTMHAFPALRAGMFFLNHADAVESEASAPELHNILLLALQWLSGSICNCSPVYPLHLLHELESRVWLLAVESSLETSNGRDSSSVMLMQSTPVGGLSHENSGASPIVMNPVDRTAYLVAAVDGHLKRFNSNKFGDDYPMRYQGLSIDVDPLHIKANITECMTGNVSHLGADLGLAESSVCKGFGSKLEHGNAVEEVQLDGSVIIARDVLGHWEEAIGQGDVERAILALLEVGQLTAAKKLEQKLSGGHAPLELSLIEVSLKVAALPLTTVNSFGVSCTMHSDVRESLRTVGPLENMSSMEVLEVLTEACREGGGRGFCRRICVIARVGNFLDLTFEDAFTKKPTELLQRLSLKGQDAFAEAKLLVATHSMLPASIAQILAESFLKGLLAAHRGGYMEPSQREEDPVPLLWRPADFIRWARVCPSEPEIGHALMRLVISGRDIPHVCEVELMILAHRYYESSACLDGVDVLVALAATRVDSYISEGDYPSLARLVTGISNFQALRFILDLLIENGQLEVLLQKRSSVDAAMESSASIRGFRMAVLSALKHFNPEDLDAFSMVYGNFSMAHEMASLLESRGQRYLQQWSTQYDPDQSEESLEMMRFYVEAAEVYSGIDAGIKTRWCCAQASLISLQLRMPEYTWMNLSDTNARRALVDQPRFQESLIVAEAYGLDQSAEWVPVIWNQMLIPGRIDRFLSDFVSALPLTHSMLVELARFYRAEVTARGDQNQLDFSKWLSPGVPSELARPLSKSFRSVLRHVRDMKERLQITTAATGFPDVVDMCLKVVDNMSVSAGPLILRKGHGGTYVPIM